MGRPHLRPWWILGAIVALGVLAFFLAGCSSKSQWAKPGVTSQQFSEDSYRCAQEARRPEFHFAGRFGGMSDGVNPDLYRLCLETAGYARTPDGAFVGVR